MHRLGWSLIATIPLCIIQVFQHIQRTSVWYGWWILLGVASAFGLGTGLHTFLLFLGPYIAEVTMAAHDCHGVDFLTRDPTT